MSTIEIIAVVLGLACVGLTVRQNIWCWPTGLAMVALYIVIFYQVKLYSDMLLQVIYVFMQLYGWWAWLRGGPKHSQLIVTRSPWENLILLAILCIVGTMTLGSVMARYTDASFPLMDALTTAASLIAQWLMGRKKLESWLIWIIVDVVSIGLYCAKELYLTGGLYTVFLILATIGYFSWKRSMSVPRSA